MKTIDFDRVLVVAGPDENEIGLPSYLSHEPGEVYYYVVRCANKCGQIEQTLQAAVKAAIDNDGELREARPNGVFGLFGRQRQDGKVEIVWSYNPIEQKSSPAEMRIYSNAGSGEIDFQQPIDSVPYKGRNFYRFESEALGDGRYQFAVRAADIRGNERDDMKKIEIEVQNKTVGAIEILEARGL